MHFKLMKALPEGWLPSCSFWGEHLQWLGSYKTTRRDNRGNVQFLYVYISFLTEDLPKWNQHQVLQIQSHPFHSIRIIYKDLMPISCNTKKSKPLSCVSCAFSSPLCLTHCPGSLLSHCSSVLICVTHSSKWLGLIASKIELQHLCIGKKWLNSSNCTWFSIIISLSFLFCKVEIIKSDSTAGEDWVRWCMWNALHTSRCMVSAP
jgi:hypothetical protein